MFDEESVEIGENESLNSCTVYGQKTLAHLEPVFLNVYGAQESNPRNEFRQLM
jgi:hypothetical protein